MICPAPRGSRKGNRVTANRWARLLLKLGHHVSIRQTYGGERCDMMVALHARRSAAAIHRFAQENSAQPLVVALTGTDLYRDIRTNRRAQRSLRVATRLVVLQPNGIDELPDSVRAKARVILQSAIPTKIARRDDSRRRDEFRVCVLGHLRHEKDPLRAAFAARLLPHDSKIRIVHAGEALDTAMGRKAHSESARTRRYKWIGEISNARARRLLASSDLMLLSSRIEGGANVLSEAIADSVPIIASDIPSSRGILGPKYPGLYPVGNTRKLADLLARAETDAKFYHSLKQWCGQLRTRFTPQQEAASWHRLIAELDGA
jgi:putative glycosyltransferase (TIGR04348 family)